jgi:hypothetical protein
MTRFSITITEHEFARAGRPGNDGSFQSVQCQCAPSERTDDSDRPRDASFDEAVAPLRD